MDDFLIARNPEPDSTLPFLIRLPVGNGVVLRTKDVWPRTGSLYCHPDPLWPAHPEIVERVPVVSCVRRGAAIDLVLDRGRENRSQVVFTKGRGREMVFWQTARTRKAARPDVSLPSARASGLAFEIVVDVHERYAWSFGAQQATTRKAPVVAGDYAVHDPDTGELVATVERKSLTDLVSTLTGGKLRSLLGALAAAPRAALVVEDRWSSVFKLDRVRPAVVADGLAEAQVLFPNVPIVFCETRPLAQEWTYRFLGAALAARRGDAAGVERIAAATLPDPSEVRAWARANGLAVSDRGRIPAGVAEAFARRDRSVEPA